MKPVSVCVCLYIPVQLVVMQDVLWHQNQVLQYTCQRSTQTENDFNAAVNTSPEYYKQTTTSSVEL